MILTLDYKGENAKYFYIKNIKRICNVTTEISLYKLLI